MMSYWATHRNLWCRAVKEFFNGRTEPVMPRESETLVVAPLGNRRGGSTSHRAVPAREAESVTACENMGN